MLTFPAFRAPGVFAGVQVLEPAADLAAGVAPSEYSMVLGNSAESGSALITKLLLAPAAEDSIVGPSPKVADPAVGPIP